MKRLYIFLLFAGVGNVFGAVSFDTSLPSTQDDRSGVGALSSSSSLSGLPARVPFSPDNAEVVFTVDTEMVYLESRYRQLSTEVNENEKNLKLAKTLVNKGEELLRDRDPKEAITFFAAALDTCEGKLCAVLPKICVWASMAFFHMGKTEEACYYVERAALVADQYEENLKARKEILERLVSLKESSDSNQ